MKLQIRRWIRYRLERLLLRGAHARLLLMAALIVLTSLAFGALAWLGGDGFESIFDAVWWAFLRLSDPGYLGDDQGAWLRTVSTMLTLLGYVLFLGAMVAIMTQWLNQTINSYEEGTTPISISGHLLILGWTNRTPPLVKEILQSQERVERFLRLHDIGNLRIVILAETDRLEMLRELKEDLGRSWRHGQVVFRTGSPLRLEHLERTNYAAASAIIIPGSDVAAGSPADPDASTIKSMLAVSTWAQDSGALPVLVAEILDAARKPVAEEAYAGRVETVATEATASLLMAQNVRHASLSEAFIEFLTQNEGNELYIREADRFIGQPFGELHRIHPLAIPIGLLRSNGGRRRAWLNPPANEPVQSGDWLVLIAKSLAEARIVDDSIARVAANAPTSTSSGISPATPAPARRVVVLGWSEKIPGVVRELARYKGEPFDLTVLSSVPADEREQAMAGIPLEQGMEVRHLEGELSLLTEAQVGLLSGCHNLLLAAHGAHATEEEADARTITNLLMVRRLLTKAGNRPHILVELLDEDNEPLVSKLGVTALVTPLLTSHITAQVALRPELNDVFETLFGYGRSEMMPVPAAAYGLTGRQSRFQDVQAAVSARGGTALGLFLHRTGATKRLALNPPRNEEFLLGPEDEVVTLVSPLARAG